MVVEDRWITMPELTKRILSFLFAGAVALGVIVGAISWFQMSPQDRQAVWSAVGKVLLWVGVVGLLPWATFFLTTWVARRESNWVASVLVGSYTLAELGLLLWLFDFSVGGTTGWVLILLGFLVALTYNVLSCDWIAEKLGF